MIKITRKNKEIPGNRAKDLQAMPATAIHRLRWCAKLDPAAPAFVVSGNFPGDLHIVDTA